MSSRRHTFAIAFYPRQILAVLDSFLGTLKTMSDATIMSSVAVPASFPAEHSPTAAVEHSTTAGENASAVAHFRTGMDILIREVFHTFSSFPPLASLTERTQRFLERYIFDGGGASGASALGAWGGLVRGGLLGGRWDARQCARGMVGFGLAALGLVAVGLSGITVRLMLRGVHRHVRTSRRKTVKIYLVRNAEAERTSPHELTQKGRMQATAFAHYV